MMKNMFFHNTLELPDGVVYHTNGLILRSSLVTMFVDNVVKWIRIDLMLESKISRRRRGGHAVYRAVKHAQPHLGLLFFACLKAKHGGINEIS